MCEVTASPCTIPRHTHTSHGVKEVLPDAFGHRLVSRHVFLGALSATSHIWTGPCDPENAILPPFDFTPFETPSEDSRIQRLWKFLQISLLHFTSNSTFKFPSSLQFPPSNLPIFTSFFNSYTFYFHYFYFQLFLFLSGLFSLGHFLLQVLLTHFILLIYLNNNKKMGLAEADNCLFFSFVQMLQKQKL